MKKYPFCSDSVILYRLSRGRWILINPLGRKIFMPIQEKEARILEQCDGNRSLREIARLSGVTYLEATQAVRKLSGSGQKAIKIFKLPLKAQKKRITKEKKYAEIVRGVYLEKVAAQTYNNRESRLTDYHRKKISDAKSQFDLIETTVSHVYRDAHPLLGGKDYGAAFAGVLKKKGLLRKKIKILEVGGGTGLFGRNFLNEIKRILPEIYSTINYTFFDLSPVLLNAQRKAAQEHCEITRFLSGEIVNYDFGSEKFDLIISNEMIADLGVIRLQKSKIENNDFSGVAQAKGYLENIRFDFSDAQEDFLFNYGAIKFLKTIAKILKQGGAAFVIEYGSESAYPVSVKLGGHVERSINFLQLKLAAKQVGLNPRLSCLADFLPFNKKIKLVDDNSFRLINDYLLPYLKQREIPRLVYTRKMMQDALKGVFCRLSGIRYCTLGKGKILMDPFGFYALELKPDNRRSPKKQ